MFYYDKELKRWVNKNDPNSVNATAPAPPPPKGTELAIRSASTGNLPARTQPPAAISAPISGPTPALTSLPGAEGIVAQCTGHTPSSLAPPQSAGTNLMPRSVSAGSPHLIARENVSGTGPPSRPGTALSNASSIDDLLGAPQPRKANTVRGRKKGRGYVDVMSK